jgi:MFS family permease
VSRRAASSWRRAAATARAAARPAPEERTIWLLGVGALGLAWPTATIAAYLPPVLERFTDSGSLIGLVLASDGVFALLLPPLVGPLSDATSTPFGRRRPYLALAVLPLALPLAVLGSMPTLAATTALLFVVLFGNYLYEPPWRGLYADLLPDGVAARAQGAAHVLRGVAMAGALGGGGLALAAWRPLPFVIAACVTGVACAAVAVLVQEPARPRRRRRLRVREALAVPLAIVRTERDVRRFLVANTAWETTFAGMRTFVVLYIVEGLGQSLAVSSAVLTVVTVGYAISAAALGPFADRLGLGRVIVTASVVYGLGLLSAGFATRWHDWYYGLVLVVAVAGGAVMTLAWGLLFKLMPHHDQGAVSALAIMTRGVGLLVGPPLAGVAVDVARPFLTSTDGYAAVWPTVAVPVLAVIPLVLRLSRHEPVEAEGARGRA